MHISTYTDSSQSKMSRRGNRAMTLSIEPFFQLVFIFLLLLLSSTTSQLSLDSLTPSQPLRDGDILVSSRKIFTLGFFSPGSSRHRYVGVWYSNVPSQTVVWVANRDNPVSDSSGVLSIDGYGGLVIHANNSSIKVWSANVTLNNRNTSIAKLLDTGNFVLLENEESQMLVWEGFDYPTNVFLPYMKLGYNRSSRINRLLTSWKSHDDPGTGNYSYGIAPHGLPQLVLHQRAGGAPLWRNLIGGLFRHFWSASMSYINTQDEVYIMYVLDSESVLVRTVLNESGIMERSTWKNQDQWYVYWSAPKESCDMYGQCGPNGNCNHYSLGTIDCVCLPGYEPKSPTDWYLRDGSGGCSRRKGAPTMCGNGEGFVGVERVKIPDMSNASYDRNLNLKECEQMCLKNCSCVAYSSSDLGNGCVTWPGDLMDIRTRLDADDGQVLYVRVDATVLAEYAKKSDGLSKKGKVKISLSSVMVLFLVSSLVVWLVRMKRRGKRGQNEFIFGNSIGSTNSEQSNGGTNVDDTRMKPDLPFFDLATVAVATNNFSSDNKLGTGGFGSVYKGVLSNGKKIAVKRLSHNSGQGTEEFKNEVLLISKLQHRNLVRILGCCVQDEEKMIIYEYLPNKSLDFFIFNKSSRANLDWTRRFEIICGIVRGILYLHQDSRLRIIHRDLKASNILLDASMNPKIADFGMARILRGDQNEAVTNRVVGTYGYMSPEYALRGRFSVKSDVYSFGVLLLEIITGRKNKVYYQQQSPDSYLVEHVWNLWRENKAIEVVDSFLWEAYPKNEVARCIHIALLCVQEDAIIRPTMSAVHAMLGNDTALASPKEPAFLLHRSATTGDSLSKNGAGDSVNDVTCSMVEAR